MQSPHRTDTLNAIINNLEDELEVLHQLSELIIVFWDQVQKGTANVAEEKRSMYLLAELHKYLLTIPQ